MRYLIGFGLAVAFGLFIMEAIGGIIGVLLGLAALALNDCLHSAQV